MPCPSDCLSISPSEPFFSAPPAPPAAAMNSALGCQPRATLAVGGFYFFPVEVGVRPVGAVSVALYSTA